MLLREGNRKSQKLSHDFIKEIVENHGGVGNNLNPIALRPKLYTILAFLSAVGLNEPFYELALVLLSGACSMA